MIVYWNSYQQNVSVSENVTFVLWILCLTKWFLLDLEMIMSVVISLCLCIFFPPKDRELWQNKNKNKNKIELTNNCHLVCFKKIYLRIFSKLPIKTNWEYFLSIKICIIYAKSQPLEHALHIKNHKNIKPNFWQ